MRVFVLGSGSSGNCIVVESDGARIVLDAGVNPTAATVKIRALGGDLFPLRAMAILVTHQHGDHIAHALPLARALSAPVFLHRGIEAPRIRKKLEVRDYAPGAVLRIGPFTIDALAVPHDAPQVALRVSAGGKSFGLATDLGHVQDDLADFLGACDAALVEANYCPELLEVGPYPPRLRLRVRGPLGHLANDQTAELARRLVGRRIARLVLGHVSRANNSPERALEVVATRCNGLPVEVIPHGVPRLVDVAASPRAANAFAQLDLRF